MAAETAAARFTRDTTYKTLTSVANHEDGNLRFARNYVDQDPTRLAREYVAPNADSALEDYVDSL